MTTAETEDLLKKFHCRTLEDNYQSVKIDELESKLHYLDGPLFEHLEANDQSVKSDKGKPKLSMAPIEEVWKAIAEVREYGIEKYHDPDNWKKVEINRYWDALYRHIAATVNDHHSVDSESGIEHLKHALCNIAFILELEKENKN